jgi:hypothetical protein
VGPLMEPWSCLHSLGQSLVQCLRGKATSRSTIPNPPTITYSLGLNIAPPGANGQDMILCFYNTTAK